MEAHGTTLDAVLRPGQDSDRTLATDRPHALRQAIMACRKGGTVSIPGVYGGLLDKFPIGAAFAKGLTFKMGQTHVHTLPAAAARAHREAARSTRRSSSPTGSRSTTRREVYKTFRDKQDDCIKVVLKPDGNGHFHAHGGTATRTATANGGNGRDTTA